MRMNYIHFLIFFFVYIYIPGPKEARADRRSKLITGSVSRAGAQSTGGLAGGDIRNCLTGGGICRNC